MHPANHAPLRIPYEATDFPTASNLNGHGSLRLKWVDLIWATVTVGKARHDVWTHGRYSSAEFIHRVALLYAYFDIRHGRIIRTKAFLSLDPSEKAVASFYLGMAVSKLYSDRVLGVPWLMHISRYDANWAVKYGVSAKRPDLFGCNAAGEWVVAEAKGRDRVTGALVTSMQSQKSSVATINGAAPTHRYGSATRFESGQLALRVVDPPARRDAQEVPIDPTAWLIDYYAPIVDLLESGDRQVQGRYLVGVVPGSNVEVGVSVEVAEWVRESRHRPRQRLAPRGLADPSEEVETVQRRRLVDQARTEDRQMVGRIIDGLASPDSLQDAFRDGLVVRARRPV